MPATRFAVDAYVGFVREKSLLEAVAASLTELFAPKIHAERIEGLLAHYAFANEPQPRLLSQAARRGAEGRGVRPRLRARPRRHRGEAGRRRRGAYLQDRRALVAARRARGGLRRLAASPGAWLPGEGLLAGPPNDRSTRAGRLAAWRATALGPGARDLGAARARAGAEARRDRTGGAGRVDGVRSSARSSTNSRRPMPRPASGSPRTPASSSAASPIAGWWTRDRAPPMAMLAELTHRCPLACPYCSNPVELTARSGSCTADRLDGVRRGGRPRGAATAPLRRRARLAA